MNNRKRTIEKENLVEQILSNDGITLEEKQLQLAQIYDRPSRPTNKRQCFTKYFEIKNINPNYKVVEKYYHNKGHDEKDLLYSQTKAYYYNSSKAFQVDDSDTENDPEIKCICVDNDSTLLHIKQETTPRPTKANEDEEEAVFED